LNDTASLREVPLPERSFDLLRAELTTSAWGRLEAARDDARDLFAGPTIWFVNSTSQGGGVAEMLRTLLPYWRGSGIDVRWLVIEASPAFFRLTKRVHNLLHGVPVRRPGLRDRALFEGVSRAIGIRALELVAPNDLVVLEDPQTAGLVPVLKRAGSTVVWRSHVGADKPSAPVEDAWRFLLPFVGAADAFVFTRREYVPTGLDPRRELLLAPAIDPVSAKNQALSPEVADAILHRCGLVRARHRPGPSRVVISGGRTVEVRRRCRVLREGPPPRLGSDRLVVALARWDRLKDPVGILRGFARHVDAADVRMILAGPATGAVADDPEGRAALREAKAAWDGLPRSRRRRIDLAVLPMVDVDENALMVNALQRHAAVVIKKSLQEGFGLGVTEGMWKARPVVATRVGGHQDQIEHRRSGLLVDDPADPLAFATAVNELLQDPAEALALGAAARETVRERFLADRHFVGWTAALSKALAISTPAAA
jgi:trehalose synthase